MKKVLLSLLAVAALVLSCQNYDDEFAALNTKISSLESQITSLAELRTAVTGVQSSISALQAAVAAAQAAAEAADNSDAITALATSVSAIAADLVDLQTAINGATTEADLDALKAELNTTLAALQALIESNSASIANLITANTELKDALEELGVDVDSVLAANATLDGDLTITNAAELAYAKSLGIKVGTIKGNVYVSVDETDHTGGGDGTGLKAAEVNSVLSQIIYVVGNVKIDTDVSLDFSKLVSVSGDYIVQGHDVLDDALTSVGDDVVFNYDGAYTSKIQTADNIYLVAKPIVLAATGVTPRSGTTEIDFLALTKASGLQTILESNVTSHTSGGSFTPSAGDALINTKTITIAGASTTSATTNLNATTSVKVGQAPVVSVQGGNRLTTIELHYAADYDADDNENGSAALGGVDIDATSATSVTVMARTVSGDVDINVTPDTATAGRSVTVSFPNLVSAKGFTSDALENSALSKLETLGATGLSLAYQTGVSLPALTTSTGAISLSKATSLSAPVLSRVGVANSTSATVGANITANEIEGTVSLPSLTKAGNISMTKVTTFSAPLAKVNGIDIEELSGTTVVTSIELASVSTYPASGANPGLVSGAGSGIVDPSTISSLKLNAQDVVLDLTAFTNAKTIDVTGKAVLLGRAAGSDASGTYTSTWTISSANAELVTLKLGGVLGKVIVDTGNAAGSGGSGGTAPVRDAATGTTAIGAYAASDLATITTSGTIEHLTISNNFDLTSALLDHTTSTTSTVAPIIIVDDNPNLATLRVGVNTIRDLTITNNYLLSSLNLASIVALPANFVYGTTSLNIDITDNYIDKTSAAAGGDDYKAVHGANYVTATAAAPLNNWGGMKGSVTTANASTAGAYTQAGIATLKPFFTLLNSIYWTTAARAANTAAQSQTNVTIDMDYMYQSSAVTPLATKQELDGVTIAAFDKLLLLN